MYVSGFSSADAVLVEADLGELAGELGAQRAVVPARELVDDHPADVVAVALVLAARVAEADDEQVERRGAFAPTPRRRMRQPSVGAGFAGGCLAALGRSLALGSLGLLALGRLLALALLDLGLLDARRRGDGRDHGLVRVVEERDALGRGDLGQAERVADLQRRDVDLDGLAAPRAAAPRR